MARIEILDGRRRFCVAYLARNDQHIRAKLPARFAARAYWPQACAIEAGGDQRTPQDRAEGARIGMRIDSHRHFGVGTARPARRFRRCRDEPGMGPRPHRLQSPARVVVQRLHERSEAGKTISDQDESLLFASPLEPQQARNGARVARVATQSETGSCRISHESATNHVGANRSP